MRKSVIRELLNKVIWSGEKEKYAVVVVDRLSPTGYRELSGSEIKRVLPSGFLETVEGSMIPLHRIVEVKHSGKVIFKRRV